MEIEAFNALCRHCHTLAVTNNRIYAWGSSQFRQLGLGKMLQYLSPELIVSLAQEIIVDAVAAQYHSVAFIANGRVFMHWDIHSQLNHGNTDERITPFVRGHGSVRRGCALHQRRWRAHFGIACERCRIRLRIQYPWSIGNRCE